VALQGVVVPPGQHSLRLYFWPASFLAGLALTALTWLSTFGGLLFGWRRQRPARTLAAGRTALTS